jgi:hypothetical protein
MTRNAKKGLGCEQELDFGFPLCCGFMKLGEEEGGSYWLSSKEHILTYQTETWTPPAKTTRS